jgi:hypothetical protein
LLVGPCCCCSSSFSIVLNMVSDLQKGVQEKETTDSVSLSGKTRLDCRSTCVSSDDCSLALLLSIHAPLLWAEHWSQATTNGGTQHSDPSVPLCCQHNTIRLFSRHEPALFSKFFFLVSLSDEAKNGGNNNVQDLPSNKRGFPSSPGE